MSAGSDGGTGDVTWTVRRMLSWMTDDFAGRGLPSARLDAEVLLAHALQMARVKLYLDMERPLDAAELSGVRALVKRRRGHEPVAYILGQREFYSRPFAVDARVLIPRPDTELLVDEALARLPTDARGHVLDLCTGSGCVGLTLAAERPGLHVDVTDISQEALAVAGDNARALGVAERVGRHAGDLFTAVPEPHEGYRMVVANPPYVRPDDHGSLAPDITRHEPRQALVTSDADGLTFYRRIAAGVGAVLQPGGHVLVEVGAHQAVAVRAIFGAVLAHTGSARDLAGIERVVWASDAPPAQDERDRGGEPRVEVDEAVEGGGEGGPGGSVAEATDPSNPGERPSEGR